MIHLIHQELLRRRVNVLVVGCGGTGSAIAGGLPYLHQAMLATGHPGGLCVTIMDGDAISESNCVRQPFSQAEIGLYKAVVLTNRLNLFWGVNWNADPRYLRPAIRIENIDLVIGCVDSRAARHVISNELQRRGSGVRYWLDIGNNFDSGQFILGQPMNYANRRSATRLRTAAELYPEIIDGVQDDDGEPSCSAAEALDRQRGCNRNRVNGGAAYSPSITSGFNRSPKMTAS